MSVNDLLASDVACTRSSKIFTTAHNEEHRPTIKKNELIGL